MGTTLRTVGLGNKTLAAPWAPIASALFPDPRRQDPWAGEGC